MNTIKKFRNLFFILLGLGLVQSCVQDDEYAIPPTDIACSDIWETSLTLHELVAMVDADSDGIVSFSEETIIEGYVISDDNPGNFFKTISIQDSPTNPTIGVQVEIDEYNLANYFPIGSKIKINLKNIYAGFDRGVYKVGETYVQGDQTRVGRMRSSIFKNHVKRSCGDLVTIEPVVFETITEAKTSGKLNTLIKINNVQFTDEMLNLPFAAPNVTEDKLLEDESGSTVILRNSGYSDFADQIVPEGSGSITVVMSKYNSTVQLYIRDENDVQFNNPRFGDGNGGGGEGNDQEAANFLFNGADFENWTNFLGSLNSFGLTTGLAVQSPGTGRDGSNSFYLNGTTGSTNPYVFTVRADASTIPANATKITMWIKGSSAKSLSFNLDTTSGRVFYNIGDLGAENLTLSPQENNQYIGTVNTNDQWRLVTLNITGLTLNTTGDLLALKAGSGTAYNLHIDNIKID
ncbi:DUF5689 domain-containing protein [Moheibacter sediminis]|uniref:DUF5689 domain-containing protein n=1 Tax=Moheibacter sediminis TaxID=1434700 RepID=A0A1W1Y9N1_9FLAO|nr:DUF5689 domain-containing protein [Moheibacter sediminis]SMC32834.1 hypothetical protein SAMN06296427_101145 [Moheibacter sediminis]